MIIRKLLRDLIPAGVHRAIIVWAIDLGWQRTPFDNNLKRQLLLTFELVNLKTSDGRPMLFTSRPYAASLHEKSNLFKLLKRLELDTSKDFDPQTLVKMPCRISIVHEKGKNGVIYAAMDSVFPADPKEEMPDPHNPVGFFDADRPDRAFLATLPAFIQQRIAEAVVPGETRKAASLPTVNIDETLPF